MKFQFKTLLASVAIMVSAATFQSAYADTQFYGSAGLTSDYVFRGSTLSNESATLQGNIGVQTGSGLYGEVFGSQVEVDDNDFQTVASGGFRKAVGVLTLDVGVSQYNYFGGTEDDNTEVFAGLTGDIGIVTVSGTVNHDIDTDANYYNVKGKFTPFFDISAIGSYGVLDVDGETTNDWYVALGKQFGSINVEGGYYANDSDFDLAKLADNKLTLKAFVKF